ncbi:hypothetical protein VT03_24125 [Planctomyces sp. SH-PL14]|nr:hypothetical protein VT03_24125 [Planctomyces sp. SH-PL14]
MKNTVAFLSIVLMSIFAAILYGILHDQITARICVEYFTIGHPPIFGTDDPTLLAFGWGIVATWWAGLIVGIPLAIAARAGSRPRRSPASLIAPLGRLFLIMGASAVLAGAIGGLLASRGAVVLVGRLARAVPAERHVPFLIDLWAHSASYLVGFVGGWILTVLVWFSRRKLAVAQ